MQKPKFVTIPEIATHLCPFLKFLKLSGLTITGFAQPNPTNKNEIKPNMSKCLTGLSDSLPVNFGVGSPNL